MVNATGSEPGHSVSHVRAEVFPVYIDAVAATVQANVIKLEQERYVDSIELMSILY